LDFSRSSSIPEWQQSRFVGHGNRCKKRSQSRSTTAHAVSSKEKSLGDNDSNCAQFAGWLAQKWLSTGLGEWCIHTSSLCCKSANKWKHNAKAIPLRVPAFTSELSAGAE